jgi:hypothetical protein
VFLCSLPFGVVQMRSSIALFYPMLNAPLVALHIPNDAVHSLRIQSPSMSVQRKTSTVVFQSYPIRMSVGLLAMSSDVHRDFPQHPRRQSFLHLCILSYVNINRPDYHFGCINKLNNLLRTLLDSTG